MSFKTKKQLFNWLDENSQYILRANNGQMKDIVVRIMAEPIANDVVVMSNVYKWFFLNSNKSFAYLVAYHSDSFYHLDLSPFHFHLICGIRGPLTETSLDEVVLKQLEKDKLDDAVINAACHKDFPLNLRVAFYEKTGQVEYLPEEAQDIFVF